MVILQTDRVVYSTNLLFKFEGLLSLETGKLPHKTVNITIVTYKLLNIEI